MDIKIESVINQTQLHLPDWKAITPIYGGRVENIVNIFNRC